MARNERGVDQNDGNALPFLGHRGPRLVAVAVFLGAACCTTVALWMRDEGRGNALLEEGAADKVLWNRQQCCDSGTSLRRNAQVTAVP